MNRLYAPLLSTLLLVLPAVGAQPITVTAKSAGGAPGAIVCADLASVSAALDLYNQNRQAAAHPGPQGQSTLTNGDALEQSPVDSKGCAVAKAGMHMTLNSVKNGAASVTFKLPDGQSFSGVTQPRMYSGEPGSSR